MTVGRDRILSNRYTTYHGDLLCHIYIRQYTALACFDTLAQLQLERFYLITCTVSLSYSSDN